MGEIFGGGGQQSGSTKPDAISQALNQLKLDQLTGLFSGSPVSQFGRPRPDLATPTPQTQSLLDSTFQDGNFLNFQDYLNLGLDESSNFISQVATPQIMQQAALQGLEGGGVVPESIAKATAGIAMPFLQTLPGASALQAQTTQALLPISDYPRALRENEFLRQQGVVTSGLTGIPFSPGSSTKGTSQQLPLFNLFGLGSFTG